MSAYIDATGYWQLSLRKDKRIKHIRPHRHIYEAFYGRIPEGYQINHKDGNKTNNKLNNLELMTNSENTKHGYDNGLYHSIHRSIMLEVFDKDNNYLITYPSIRQASEELKINRKTLSSILFNNKTNNTPYLFKPILDTESETTNESAVA